MDQTAVKSRGKARRRGRFTVKITRSDSSEWIFPAASFSNVLQKQSAAAFCREQEQQVLWRGLQPLYFFSLHKTKTKQQKKTTLSRDAAGKELGGKLVLMVGRLTTDGPGWRLESAGRNLEELLSRVWFSTTLGSVWRSRLTKK